MPELLLELFSEEIPARMQRKAAEDLRALVTNGLVEAGLTYEGAQAHATPRRLVLSVEGLVARAADVKEERKGPRVDAPRAAIDGFLKSTGLKLDDLVTQEDKKGKFYVAAIRKTGRAATEIVAELVPQTIREFLWPKSMRWGSGSLRWVRPLQSILCAFDGEVVPFQIDGLTSGNVTRGHRFMAPGQITARRFEDYARKLGDAFVMVDAGARAETIRSEARNLAFAQGLELMEDEGLLKETSGLVEWPVVLMGAFDESFLSVPPEVVATTLKTHQKCFALRDANASRPAARAPQHEGGPHPEVPPQAASKGEGRLSNKYLLVANLVAADGGRQVVAGNNKVIAARLSDAKFFWDHDRKVPLRDLAPKLDAITFHAKLGTQGERVTRIEALAAEIARLIGADVEKARLAANLAKADLVTGMVGEFPELQGHMGRYYALEQGIDGDVADAIRDHYKPQGPANSLPVSKIGQAVAIADKLDTLAGFWLIDEKPTGSKDPFALRRAALGVIRCIEEKALRLPLAKLFERALAQFMFPDEEAQGGVPAVLVADLLAFFADRLKVYLREQGARHDLIDAVFALGGQDDLLMIVRRVEALSKFLESDDGQHLQTGISRANNILRIEEKKDGRSYGGDVRIDLLIKGEEKALHSAITIAVGQARLALAHEDFAAAMAAIAKLRSPVDTFFDHVTVNDRDATFRENRLKLLNRIRAATLEVADFSKLEG